MNADVGNEQRNSLNRLIKVAKSKTGQSQLIANFLLAWWNAQECGGFDLDAFRSIDSDYVQDMVNVIRIIATEKIDPRELGLEEEFTNLIKLWRPHLLLTTD